MAALPLSHTGIFAAVAPLIEESNLSGLKVEAESLDARREKLPEAIEDRLHGPGEQLVQFELIVPGTVKITGA